MSLSRTIIVGIGSPHGDDRAGLLVADGLAGVSTQNGVVVRKAKSPAELLDWLDGFERLVVCDACRGLGRLGVVKRWTWPTAGLAAASWSGTHDLSLPAVLQLSDRLGRLPRSVIIWTVEGALTDTMTSISPEVEAALPKVIGAIAEEVTRGIQCTKDHSFNHS